jgi:N-acetylmuramoyl-L-alanine amidase/Hemopexin
MKELLVFGPESFEFSTRRTPRGTRQCSKCCADRADHSERLEESEREHFEFPGGPRTCSDRFEEAPHVARARGITGVRPEQAPASALRPQGCAYFFKRAGYVRFNIATESVDVGPAAISQFWNLPPNFRENIDAAVNRGDGHAYFFKGSGYVRYNIATDTVDVGPAPISQFWRLPPEFQSNLDAAVSWNDRHVYLFKGAGYVRYNLRTDLVDVGPVAISRFWRLPEEFQRDLDAALGWSERHVYFFKSSGYVRYDVINDRVDVGPVAISRFWNLPVEFQSDIGAAVNWTFPTNLAGLMRAAGLAVDETTNWHTRSTGQFNPVGIIMHHTVGVGPNALADVVTNNKANFYVGRDAVLRVVSAGRANHAGVGAQRVLDEVSRGVAPTGTAAQRRLPDGPMGNGFFYGFENENRGDGIQPWPQDQLDTMAIAAAALCRRYCWTAARVISHAEWTSRKIDPVGIDMNDFRARVAALL